MFRSSRSRRTGSPTSRRHTALAAGRSRLPALAFRQRNQVDRISRKLSRPGMVGTLLPFPALNLHLSGDRSDLLGVSFQRTSVITHNSGTRRLMYIQTKDQSGTDSLALIARAVLERDAGSRDALILPTEVLIELHDPGQAAEVRDQLQEVLGANFPIEVHNEDGKEGGSDSSKKRTADERSNRDNQDAQARRDAATPGEGAKRRRAAPAGDGDDEGDGDDPRRPFRGLPLPEDALDPLFDEEDEQERVAAILAELETAIQEAPPRPPIQQLPSLAAEPAPRRRVARQQTNINLRNGLSFNTRNKRAADRLREGIPVVYGLNRAVLEHVEGLPDTLPVNLRPINAALPLDAPPALSSELTPTQLREIRSVRNEEGLIELVRQYMQQAQPTAYLAALIHHQERITNAALRQKVQLYQLILSPPGQRTNDIDLQSLVGLLPARYNNSKRDAILGNMETIRRGIESNGIAHHDYSGSTQLNTVAAQLRQKLNEPVSGKLLMALSDYANTLFRQYAEVMESPWEIINRNQLPGGQTNDSTLAMLAIMYAAQRALEMEPLATHGQLRDNDTVYRWQEGLSHYSEGEVLSPLALYSSSMGTQSSDAFGGHEDRTLFVIRQSRTGKFIQLLTGTKNWYQREALFPAYTQFIVRQKTAIDDPVAQQRQENWYVVEELPANVHLLAGQAVQGLGLPQLHNAYQLSRDMLTATLVDHDHRQAFVSADGQPSRHELEAAGIEVADGTDVRTLSLHTLYGTGTHERWARVMQQAIPRDEILSPDTLLRLYREMMGNAGLDYRTVERGWGEDRPLSLAQQQALQENGILFYATLSQAEKDGFIAWLRRTPFQNENEGFGINNDLSKAAYIHQLQQNNEESMLVQPIFRQWFAEATGRPYDAEREPFVITYGVADRIPERVTEALDEAGQHLEQNLALHVQRAITREQYTKNVERYAAQLQQRISAIHPFDDGNGRLSRLMLYKVLQTYYPADMQEHGLPIVRDPEQDLLLGREAYYVYVFGRGGERQT